MEEPCATPAEACAALEARGFALCPPLLPPALVQAAIAGCDAVMAGAKNRV